MKKLLQINTVINSGSTGRIAEDLGKLVLSQGWDSYIAFGRNSNKSLSQKIKIGNKVGIYFHVLFARLFDKSGFYSYFVTKKFIKKIRQIKPSVIHIHNIHGYYINIDLLFMFLKTENIPIIWTLHDCWSYTGHCCHYSFIKCDKWQKKCGDCCQINEYPKSFIDNSKRNYQHKKEFFTGVQNLTIVTPSYWLANEVKQSFLSAYPIIPIHNGLDLNIFKPSEHNPYIELGINDKKIILGVANNFKQRKGFEDFLQLNEILDKDRFVIVMIGLSENQIKALPEGILGYTRTDSVQSLIDFYTFADVYFNASVEETLGMTTIEAQACGTPCIVYNSTAIPETVLADETGIIVEPGNINEVYKSIKLLLSKPKNIYSEICIDFIKNHFDKELNLQKYLNLYKECNSK